MVHLTRDLLTVLLEHATDAEPAAVNVLLSATSAADLSGETTTVDPETPVLTHFTLPDIGGSVDAVFGMDLSTPSERGRARFLSHPTGELRVNETDDLAAVVVVAVPPWEDDCVAAFDRAGRELPLHIVDAVPPEEFPPE
ncbi:hypothetical protein ACERIT_08455 [Halopenitus sp. H-Gu1]|uniref:hypothetical protein n=1 Tax=Halopenitus sp. H-Gu1 TaxID=3242697 RepID=UPI00359EB78F